MAKDKTYTKMFKVTWTKRDDYCPDYRQLSVDRVAAALNTHISGAMFHVGSHTCQQFLGKVSSAECEEHIWVQEWTVPWRCESCGVGN